MWEGFVFFNCKLIRNEKRIVCGGNWDVGMKMWWFGDGDFEVVNWFVGSFGWILEVRNRDWNFNSNVWVCS